MLLIKLLSNPKFKSFNKIRKNKDNIIFLICKILLRNNNNIKLFNKTNLDKHYPNYLI